MRNRTVAIAFPLALVFMANTAQAQIRELKFVPVDNGSQQQNVLTVYHTFDLVATFDGQYTGAQMLLELTQGSIYQSPEGNELPPSPEFVQVIPALAFDTFIAQGSPIADGLHGNPLVGIGAIDLGGEAQPRFDESILNIAWNPDDANILDQTNFLLARVTLSYDAVGAVSVLAGAQGFVTKRLNIPISEYILPEPTSFVLAALGLLSLAGLRRRR